MAGASNKKKAEKNARLLSQLKLAVLAGLAWHWVLAYFLFPSVIGWGTSPHWFFSVFSVLTSVLAGGSWYFLVWFTRPASDEPNAYREDVMGGFCVYAWDVVILSLGVLALSPFHKNFWFLLVLLPIYALWKGFSIYFNVAHGQQDTAKIKEEEEKETKRQARKERKMKKVVTVRR